MIETVLAFLITKTKIVRYLAGLASGALINSGIIKGDEGEIVAGAISAVALGLVEWIIAVAKRKHAESVQAKLKERGLYDKAVDGYFGPATAAAVDKLLPPIPAGDLPTDASWEGAR